MTITLADLDFRAYIKALLTYGRCPSYCMDKGDKRKRFSMMDFERAFYSLGYNREDLKSCNHLLVVLCDMKFMEKCTHVLHNEPFFYLIDEEYWIEDAKQ